jgi:hypothetical protein
MKTYILEMWSKKTHNEQSRLLHKFNPMLSKNLKDVKEFALIYCETSNIYKNQDLIIKITEKRPTHKIYYYAEQ